MARMQKKYKVFIAIGIVLNIILCLGLYVNNRLDHIVAGLYRPGVVKNDTLQPDSSAGDPSVVVPSSSGSAGSPGESEYRYTPGTATVQTSKLDIANGVEQKLGRPVEKKDLIAAGMIVMRKLSWDEITFLYNAGSKANQNPEELRQAREILKAKLNSEELATLKAMGGKYGQSLKFLN